MTNDDASLQYQVHDLNHDEAWEAFPNVPAAMAYLRGLAELPWDAAPIKAPCTEWETCGRDFALIEAESWGATYESIRWVRVLEIDADGAHWLGGSDGTNSPDDWRPGRWYE